MNCRALLQRKTLEIERHTHTPGAEPEDFIGQSVDQAEKRVRRDLERLAQRRDARRRDRVGTVLVFLDLLGRHAKCVTKRRLV